MNGELPKWLLLGEMCGGYKKAGNLIDKIRK